eukprot:SAG11_NODE_20923_length_435_cov_1.997024_1_plen_74_part_10
MASGGAVGGGQVTHPLGQALGTLSTPDDIADLVTFLASDRAKFLSVRRSRRRRPALGHPPARLTCSAAQGECIC